MLHRTALVAKLLLFASPLFLNGCVTTPQEQAESISPAAAEAEAAEAARRAEQERRRAERQARIASLLRSADAALADNRLTLPEHDNAYDRYAAVLLLDPDNPAALAGLDSVLLAYVGLIRKALRKGQLTQARRYQAQAEDYFGGNPLLRETASALAEAVASSRQRLKQLNSQALRGQEFDLPAPGLSRRSDEVIEFLARVAQRVKQTEESVLILARTDAEGRWIYKQMNDSVPNYRIRGDIRRAASPALRLLPPL